MLFIFALAAFSIRFYTSGNATCGKLNTCYSTDSVYRAVYIQRKYGKKALSSSSYLSEAEPFLEQYAKRSQQNQALIGSAGNLVSAEDFMAIVEGGRDEEGDLDTEKEEAPPSPITSTKDTVAKDEALIVFFPGINL